MRKYKLYKCNINKQNIFISCLKNDESFFGDVSKNDLFIHIRDQDYINKICLYPRYNKIVIISSAFLDDYERSESYNDDI